MLELDLTIPDLPETLRDIEGINDMVLDEAVITMRRDVDTLEQAVIQRTPVGATAQTRQGWSTDVQRRQNAVRGIVGNSVPHAIFAERGRAPGKQPPLDPIELWVRRVLGISPRESRSVAFLVARAIGRRGTEGAHMAEEGLEATRPIIEADFAALPQRVARRFDAS